MEYVNWILGSLPFIRSRYRQWSHMNRILFCIVASIVIIVLKLVFFACAVAALQRSFGVVKKLRPAAYVLVFIFTALQLQTSSLIVQKKSATPKEETKTQINTPTPQPVSETKLGLEKLQLEEKAKAESIRNEAAKEAAAAAASAQARSKAQKEEAVLSEVIYRTPVPTPTPAQPKLQPALQPTQTPQPARSACHPSYDPCLPIRGDMNCPEVKSLVGSVRVIGPDDYRLDRDKDGIGCE
jgi:hypothetical protein